MTSPSARCASSFQYAAEKANPEARILETSEKVFEKTSAYLYKNSFSVIPASRNAVSIKARSKGDIVTNDSLPSQALGNVGRNAFCFRFADATSASEMPCVLYAPGEIGMPGLTSV